MNDLNKKSKPERYDEEFDNIIGIEIPVNRLKNGTDKKLRSRREVTSKLLKHPLFPKLVEDLETFKFLEDE